MERKTIEEILRDMLISSAQSEIPFGMEFSPYQAPGKIDLMKAIQSGLISSAQSEIPSNIDPQTLTGPSFRQGKSEHPVNDLILEVLGALGQSGRAIKREGKVTINQSELLSALSRKLQSLGRKAPVSTPTITPTTPQSIQTAQTPVNEKAQAPAIDPSTLIEYFLRQDPEGPLTRHTIQRSKREAPAPTVSSAQAPAGSSGRTLPKSLTPDRLMMKTEQFIAHKGWGSEKHQAKASRIRAKASAMLEQLGVDPTIIKAYVQTGNPIPKEDPEKQEARRDRRTTLNAQMQMELAPILAALRNKTTRAIPTARNADLTPFTDNFEQVIKMPSGRGFGVGARSRLRWQDPNRIVDVADLLSKYANTGTSGLSSGVSGLDKYIQEELANLATR